ncbi:hypothetical protein [Vampirovibrio sp.]|uniref:hypothetical protein n=1 Tax=Vampirovibrio sp. TaxID=2717857 RepID=UPI003593FC29
MKTEMNPFPVFSFRLSKYGAALGYLVVSTVFSPLGWLLNIALSPYLNEAALRPSVLSPGAFAQVIVAMSQQLRELGPVVLLQEVLPLLVLCLALSVVYGLILGWLFQKAVQHLTNRFSATS